MPHEADPTPLRNHSAVLIGPINLQAGEIFKIRAGKIHEIEANGFLLPCNAASGWQ